MLISIQTGKVAGYSTSMEAIEGHALEKEENVTAFPPQAWYTNHSLNNLKRIWVENIQQAIEGKFQNLVY